MLTAQGQSVSLWGSLSILLSRWDIDSINPDEGYYVPDEGYSRNASCGLPTCLIRVFLYFFRSLRSDKSLSDELTAQGQSISLWGSLLILLSRWDIDSINLYTF
jgi:hypothetical protein